MSNRVEARSRARIACDEHQTSLFCARGRPSEVVLRMHWLVVLIDPHQSHVDVEAWEVEIVRITTEERRLKFRDEYQTHVGILLVPIEVVLSPLVKGNYIRAKARGLGRLSLDGRNFCPSGCKSLRIGRTGFHRGIDASGHVFDAHQYIQLQTGRLDFFGACSGYKAFFGKIFLRGAHLVNNILDNVVISENQTVRGNKGT